MTAPSHIRRIKSDWTGDELAIMAATMTASDPADVCEVIGVVIVHSPEGHHELKMMATSDETPERLARVLRHAADHVLGNCEPCRTAAGNGGHSG